MRHNFISFVIFIPYLLMQVGCSGYRLNNKGNPFRVEQIQSISIPMFINYSVVGNVSNVFTSEITSMLEAYPKLKVYAGENRSADAILIGIIHSNKRKKEVFSTANYAYTNSDVDVKNSIGQRADFFIPSSTKFSLSLQLVLIKNPTWEEMKAIKGPYGKLITNHPKVIFNTNMVLGGSFAREVKGTVTSDSAGVTNDTKTAHFLRQAIKKMAENGAENFKQLVLDVF
jgi:hypothetical protein